MQRDQLKNIKRLVIKIGSNSIVSSFSKVDYRKIDRLAFVISSLQQEGIETILVSSGAIAAGANLLGVEEYPREIPEQQALASVGQGELMNIYSRSFSYYDQIIGQVLLTRDVIEFPKSLENVENALETLFKKGVVPIINENDTISVDELNHKTLFGDNDTLSAIVAEIVGADLLIILSDVDGFYSGNPLMDETAKKFNIIKELNDEILGMAQGKGSEFSSGGMETKLVAAERMLNNNKALVIMSGDSPDDLFKVINGEEIGTLFLSENSKLGGE